MNKRFKEMRKALGLTQEQIGDLVGISGSTVAQIEAGRSRPTDAAIKLICATYHVNWLWLTEGTGPMLEAEDLETRIDRAFPTASEFERNILKAFAKLPDDDWIKLRTLIDEIKKEGT